MDFFKRLKFWKRAGNRKTGIIRGILKCLVPCIRQTSRSTSPPRSRSPSPERIIKENKTQENCKETSYGRTGAHSESLRLSGSLEEYFSCFLKISSGEEKFSKRMWNVESPHNALFDGIPFGEAEKVRRREEEGLRLRGFEKIEHLGSGRFGIVVLARKKWNYGKCFREEKLAIKIVPREHVREVEEKVFKEAIGHPFLVHFFSSFWTVKSLCYKMEYLEGGTLYSLMSKLKRFHEHVARVYLAEIVLAVEFLHSRRIVHRDIKPANILLDRDGHCKLADFGACQVGRFFWNIPSSFIGTHMYVAPEVCHGLWYGTGVDWWAVGCVMQDMMVGEGRPRLEVADHPEYPKILTPDALDILKRFLNPDPLLRLGARGDISSILNHSFFKSMNWRDVKEKLVTPPVNPLTLKFLTVEPDAPGDGDDIGRNPSINNGLCEAVLEQPPLQPLTVNCPTTDPGARDAADESGSDISFKSALEGASGDADDSRSTTSFKSAVE